MLLQRALFFFFNCRVVFHCICVLYLLGTCSPMFLLLFVQFFCLFVFWGPHLQHMEVPRLGKFSCRCQYMPQLPVLVLPNLSIFADVPDGTPESFPLVLQMASPRQMESAHEMKSISHLSLYHPTQLFLLTFQMMSNFPLQLILKYNMIEAYHHLVITLTSIIKETSFFK